MKALLAVAAKEITERRTYGFLALAAALIPWISPFLPGAGHHPPQDIRNATALVVAAAAAVLLSLSLGSSLLSRELSEGRLGFYLCLPLKPWQIWGGKVLGALVILYGTLLLALLAPISTIKGWTTLDALYGGISLSEGYHTFGLLPAMATILGPMILLLASQHAATAMRVRSPWLALDVGLFPVLGYLVWLSAKRLWDFWADWEMETGLSVLLAAALTIALVASWLQLSKGRVVERLAHGWISGTTWAGISIACLSFLGYVDWVFGATPADLTELQGARASSDGDWAVVSGRLRHRPDFRRHFLVHTSTDSWKALGPVPGRNDFWPRLHFAANGKSAIWLRGRDRERRDDAELTYFDLGNSDIRTVETPLSFSRSSILALSPDGTMLAELTSQRVAVYSLPDGALLAIKGTNTAIGKEWRSWSTRVFFPDSRTLRVIQVMSDGDGGSVLRVAHFDLATSKFKVEEGHSVLDEYCSIMVSRDGSRLALFHSYRGKHGVSLHDGKTGAPIATLRPSDEHRRRGLFMADGTITLVERPSRDQEEVLFRRYDSLGEELGAFGFPGGKNLFLGTEISPGVLQLAVEDDQKNFALYEVSLDDGTWHQVAADLRPARSWWEYMLLLGFLESADWNTPATLYWRTSDNSLVRLDRETGEVSAILPKP